jgi:hypothetical protein
MTKAQKITSLQNKRIKNIKLLSEKSAARKDQQLFVVEGLKECLMVAYLATTMALKKVLE